MRIYVDADSCPREARDMLLRFSTKRGIVAVFVANRPIPGIKIPWINNNGTEKANREKANLAKNETALMEICPKDEGAADDRIVALACQGDLAITRDLPLAERLVERDITVLDDRGRIYTRENIRERRSLRDFTVGLARNGMETERTRTYGKKELNAFANSLDRELSRLTKGTLNNDSNTEHPCPVIPPQDKGSGSA